MTILEAIQSYLTDYDVNSTLIEKVLIDNEVDGTATYSTDYIKEVEICLAYIYKQLALRDDFKQGSLSITNSQSKKLMNLASNIFKKYGITDEIINKTIIKIL